MDASGGWHVGRGVLAVWNKGSKQGCLATTPDDAVATLSLP
ncbi:MULTISPECIES: hypothetical protein [Halomonas]|nr:MULTISPECIES: hypothetical protein [Halomonas]